MSGNGSNGQVEVKVPGFGYLKAHGRDALLVVLIAAVLAAQGMFTYWSEQRQRDRDTLMLTERAAMLDRERQRAKDREVEHTAIVKAITEAQDESSYIATLTEGERRALKLKMPTSLRAKQRDN